MHRVPVQRQAAHRHGPAAAEGELHLLLVVKGAQPPSQTAPFGKKSTAWRDPSNTQLKPKSFQINIDALKNSAHIIDLLLSFAILCGIISRPMESFIPKWYSKTELPNSWVDRLNKERWSLRCKEFTFKFANAQEVGAEMCSVAYTTQACTLVLWEFSSAWGVFVKTLIQITQN